jgi:NADH-quinone oxidoreductase subunit N
VLAVAALLVTAGADFGAAGVDQSVVALGGLFELDRMAQVLKVVTLLTVAVVFVYSTDYLHRRALSRASITFWACSPPWAAWSLISAGSLITLYLGLELMSLCLYAMVAFDRDSGIAAESAIKYFVLGSMASGTLAVRHVDLYGVTGTSNSPAIAMPCARVRGEHRLDIRHRVPHRRDRDSNSARCRFTCGSRTCTRDRRPA